MPRTWVPILTACTALLLLVPSAAADGDSSSYGWPRPATAAAKRGLVLTERARRDVEHAHPHCRPTLPRGRLAHARPDAALLAQLGILRRPGTAGDRLDDRDLLALGRGEVTDPGWVRLAHAADGNAYYVIPSFALGLRFGPRACARLQHRRLLHLIAGERAAVRRSALRALRALNRLEHPARPSGPTQSLAILQALPDGTGDGGGGDVASLATQGLFDEVGLSSRSSLVFGVVPDGVATITVRYGRAGLLSPFARRRRAYPAPLVVTTPVQDDVASFHVARAPLDATPLRMTWRAADGSVVRVVRPPRERNVIGG